ncbi:MAG: hypothetical protein J1F01_02665 [Oscillospiraceae bacterium]|nr:hypothetical protein [Oscillospiraceae bacterium]
MDENNFNTEYPQQNWNANSQQNWNNNQMYNNQGQQSSSAFVLGIISLITSLICCGGIVPIVLGIIGIINGKNDLAKNPDNSKAKTGVTLSIIGVSIGAIMMIVSIILSVTGFWEAIMYEFV